MERTPQRLVRQMMKSHRVMSDWNVGARTFALYQLIKETAMTLVGETLASGAANTCEDCGSVPELGVYRSAAGPALSE